MMRVKVPRVPSASPELSIGVMAGSPMTHPAGATRALLTDVPPTSRAMTRVFGVNVEGEGSFMSGGWFLKGASRIILKSITELRKE